MGKSIGFAEGILRYGCTCPAVGTTYKDAPTLTGKILKGAK